MPQQRPKRHLPTMMSGRLRTIVIDVATKASMLNITRALLLPCWTKLLPMSVPTRTPVIVKALIKVLKRTAWSELQSNLALMTEATRLFPMIANPV